MGPVFSLQNTNECMEPERFQSLHLKKKKKGYPLDDETAQFMRIRFTMPLWTFSFFSVLVARTFNEGTEISQISFRNIKLCFED